MTTDNETARHEDQMAGERSDMAPKGGKGPTAAAAADTEGAFGDAEGNRWKKGSATESSINEGTAFETVGGDEDEQLRPQA